MEEVSTQQINELSTSLSAAYEIKKLIGAKQSEINLLRESSGIAKLEAELQSLDTTYAEIIKQCVSANYFEDGPLRIISKGGVKRKIIPEAFHKAYPQMFFELSTIPVTASENSLSEYYEAVCGMTKKEAKAKAKAEITSICEMVGEPRYELINLTE